MQSIALTCEKFGDTSQGTAQTRDLTGSERLKRAARVAGILWGVAFLTVFIPVLHFILPPLFLLIGLGVGAMTYMEKSWRVSGEIPCPNCKKAVELPEGSESWPLNQRCPHCHTDLSINKV